MLKNNKILSPFFLLITVIFILLSIISIYQGKAKSDEFEHHIPVLQGMNDKGYLEYIFSSEYNAANTPLPYLLPHLVFKLLPIEPNLFVPRIINFFISFFSLVLFIVLLNKISTIADYRILIFLFYPYFIKTSFVFYLAIYGVFFLLLSLYFLSRSNSKSSLYAGASAACGILSQQFIAGLPIGYLIALFKRNKEKKKLILFFIPLIIPLLLFIMWGGLTHPAWRSHNPSIDITHITAALTITGGVFFPFIVDKIKELKLKYAFVVLTLSLILTIFFSPRWAELGEYGQVTGYTYNFLTNVGSISQILYYLAEILLCFTGIYLFLILFKIKKARFEELIFWVVLVFLGIIFFNNVFSERHLLPMITLLLLLTLPRIQHKWLLNIWVMYQVIFGLIYFYYWLFIHPSFA